MATGPRPHYTSLSQWRAAICWKEWTFICEKETKGWWIAIFSLPSGDLISSSFPYGNGETLRLDVLDAKGQGAIETDVAKVYQRNPRVFYTTYSDAEGRYPETHTGVWDGVVNPIKASAALPLRVIVDEGGHRVIDKVVPFLPVAK